MVVINYAYIFRSISTADCRLLGRVILGCGMLVSLTLLNAVYVTVVVTYAVQCRLLALYIECLIKRIRENTINLFDAMEVSNLHNKRIPREGLGLWIHPLLSHSYFCPLSLIFSLFLPHPSPSDPDPYPPRLYGSLTRYVKLWVAHAPGMPGTFSPPPQVNDPGMHHGKCLMHVPWCIPGSLTSGFLLKSVTGKRLRHSRRMRNPQPTKRI